MTDKDPERPGLAAIPEMLAITDRNTFLSGNEFS